MHPTHVAADTQFDLARAVFGIGYRFDDRTVFNSEYEVEHAVASAGDKGEFEVEQFYVDHQLTPWASIKGGLFLMPFGLLNEHHEPTNFYGVQRNFVETLIIPSTWREGGIALHGNTQIGLNWDAGVTTGLDLGGWEINPEDPQYRTALELEDNGVAPMQATHQELSLANAHHLSQYLSLNYSGIPGLLAGAAVFTGAAAVPRCRPVCRVSASLFGRDMRAGLRARRNFRRYMPGAASRTPPLSIWPMPAHPIPCRPSSSATTCRAPTPFGRTTATDSRRSPAGNTTTWAPRSREFPRVHHRSRGVRCGRPTVAATARPSLDFRRQLLCDTARRLQTRLPNLRCEQRPHALRSGNGFEFLAMHVSHRIDLPVAAVGVRAGAGVGVPERRAGAATDV